VICGSSKSVSSCQRLPTYLGSVSPPVRALSNTSDSFYLIPKVSMVNNEKPVVSRDNKDEHSQSAPLGKDRRRSSARPGSWDRTFSPAHERTRRGLADALVLAVGNSEKPAGDWTQPCTSIFKCTDMLRRHYFRDSQFGPGYKRLLVVRLV
jgi:hypothetical protein